MSKQINLRISKWTEEQLEDLDKWTGQTQTQVILLAVDHLWKEVKQERENKMQKDVYEIRVERSGREFKAWEGSDEQLSKEQFDLWKQQENVEKVGRFVNGNWAESPYVPRRAN